MFSGLVSRITLRSFGSVTGIDVRDDRNRDQEDDQQHQHHVDQRRGVDGRDDFVFVAVAGEPTLIAMVGLWPYGERACACGRFPDAAEQHGVQVGAERAHRSIATLLRRTSQL